MQTIEEILRTKKIKVTPQRMAVYTILKESKEHPNVEMIYQKLKPNYPAMSLATVYKTVDVLKTVGLVQELNVGEGGLRYDGWTEPHSHTYCEKCNKVSDIENIPQDYVQSEELFQKVKEETGLDVSTAQLYFYGICADCQAQMV